jgi:hypothetical protein
MRRRGEVAQIMYTHVSKCKKQYLLKLSGNQGRGDEREQ